MKNHHESSPGETGKFGHTPARISPTEPMGLKRRHFMGTALALDAAALLAACGGGRGGGGTGSSGMSGSGSVSGSSSGSGSSSSSGSGSSSGSVSGSSSGSGSASGSSSGSGSGSAAPTNWVVSTWAGTGATAPFVDGTGGTATFSVPYGVAVDTSGNVYVADSSGHMIRKITAAGVVSTLAGTGSIGMVNGTGSTAQFNNPTGVAVDTSGNVFVAEYNSHLIRKISAEGVVSTFAGVVNTPSYMDGAGSTAKFNYPNGVALDSSGNVFVADYSNHMVRKISTAGVVSTLAGVGSAGYLDGAGHTAQLNYPSGVAVDHLDNVYVADQSNHLIRKITQQGVVSTVAGTLLSAGTANGAGATAQFRTPTGVAVDIYGHVYVADYNNHLIRQISAAGVVSTMAGVGGSLGYTEGSGSTAKFNYPTGVAVDNSGQVYVADGFNHRIRKLTPI